MKFGHPLLTTELSGSMGGAVASSARGGVGYFRSRTTPANPRTPGQTIVRSIATSIATAWRSTLTTLQRAGWEGLASPTESGINVYTRGNAVAMLSGNPREDDFPASANLAFSPIVVNPVADASAHTVAVTIPVDWSGEAQGAVFVSAPQSASRASQQFNFLFIGHTDVDSSGVQTIAVPATHPAFNMVAGQVVYVRVVPFAQADGANTGKGGAAQDFRVIVVA